MTVRVILVDDEADIRDAISQTLELAQCDVTAYNAGARVLEKISADFDGVIVSDIRMPKMDGLALLAAIQEIDPDIPVVLITGHGDVPLAVSAIQAGAYDFIEKPFDAKRLTDTVVRAASMRSLALENRALRQTLESRDTVEASLVGRSDIMVALRKRLRTIATSAADVLLLGETGSGKELAARALHALSDRADKPFIAINMAALPEILIESELFGHEAGAFAGAHKARFGKFEHARGGTLFLDEIDALPLPLQAKLLRVIEERTIERIGSNDPIALDVRFIAASKTNLLDRSQSGAFRADLYYRLAVVSLSMPTVAERVEDIPMLFQHLVTQSALRHRVNRPDLRADILREISSRNWPGNVRELRNAADRYVLGLGLDDTHHAELPNSLPARMEAHERSAIAAELAAQAGNIRATYEALGVSRKTLYEKMQKYGLDRESFLSLPDDG